METITVKFVVAADSVIADIARLGRAIVLEKYAGLAQAAVLEHYITTHFNEKTLTDSINNFSNQWLVAYAGEEAVGFARLSAKGKRPPVLHDKRSMGITAFFMLRAYADQVALLEKCIGLGNQYDAIWLAEHAESPAIGLLERYGFKKAEVAEQRADDLPLPFVYLVKA
ncbi:N-acetyltransferase [Chitinophaga lutea]|uniref:N-acetyltransferase n=1 Tax=Chitinophaga lutea TaxID=2488634 RepID=A0A3N4PKH1_9BACT|nr:N-acetyltransferase [Chitinophaga lutea]RPE08028.1 N-acetyltransferase [Chitinophaga lutea]